MSEQCRDNQSAAQCGACKRCEPQLSREFVPLTGWRFVLPAVAAFVIPVAGTAIGAILAAGDGTGGTRQLAGAAAGLVAGVSVGFVLNRALRRLFRRRQEDHQGTAAFAGEELS